MVCGQLETLPDSFLDFLKSFFFSDGNCSVFSCFFETEQMNPVESTRKNFWIFFWKKKCCFFEFFLKKMSFFWIFFLNGVTSKCISSTNIHFCARFRILVEDMFQDAENYISVQFGSFQTINFFFKIWTYNYKFF